MTVFSVLFLIYFWCIPSFHHPVTTHPLPMDKIISCLILISHWISCFTQKYIISRWNECHVYMLKYLSTFIKKTKSSSLPGYEHSRLCLQCSLVPFSRPFPKQPPRAQRSRKRFLSSNAFPVHQSTTSSEISQWAVKTAPKWLYYVWPQVPQLKRFESFRVKLGQHTISLQQLFFYSA